MTAFYGILNISNGELIYCNAGHNPPYILSKDGSVKRIESKGGPALGLDVSFWPFPEPYEESSLFILKKEDCLFLYTDGVTEAMSATNEIFSEVRLKQALQGSAARDSAQVVKAVNEAVKSFVDNTPQSDDIAMLAIRYI